MIAHSFTISCLLYNVTELQLQSVHLNIHLSLLYQSDTDSTLTLFNYYLFIQQACIPKITIFYTICYFSIVDN